MTWYERLCRLRLLALLLCVTQLPPPRLLVPMLHQTTLRTAGPGSLVNCRANFMDPESGSVCCMSQVSDNASTVAFGDTNGGLHLWTRAHGADPSGEHNMALNSMQWTPEAAPPPPKLGLVSDVKIDPGTPFQQDVPLVPPLIASPASALAFLPHLPFEKFPPCISDNFLRENKRNILPRSGLPIVRIRPDLLAVQQVSSATLPFIDNRKWNLPKNGCVYHTDPKFQAYVANLDPRGELSAQNSPASMEDGAFFNGGGRPRVDSFHLSESWKHQHINVSKLRFGFDNFDFGLYNRSPFAGLENLLPDSYINGIIQLFYHLPPIRDALLRHVCGRTGCLACEFGFLFDMLDQARSLPRKSRSVQATNFLGALRLEPTTKILGLLKETYSNSVPDIGGSHQQAGHPSRQLATTPANALGSTSTADADDADYLNLRAEKFLSFLLAQLQNDSSYQPPKHVKDFSDSLNVPSGEPGSAASDSAQAKKVMSVVQSHFGFEAKIQSHCRRGHSQVVSVPVLEVDLVYDNFGDLDTIRTGANRIDSFQQAKQGRSNADVAEPEPEESQYSFADILEASLCPRKATRAWCDGCKTYVPLRQRTCPASLPNILLVNCNISSEAIRSRFWVNHPQASPAADAEAINQNSETKSNVHDVPHLVVPPVLEIEICDTGTSRQARSSDREKARGKIRVRATDDTHLPASSDPQPTLKTPKKGKSNAAPTHRVYELRIIVSHVREGRSDGLADGHIVTHVKPFRDFDSTEASSSGQGTGAPSTPPKPKAAPANNDDWYIFNDFLVDKQDIREVFNFRNDWRTVRLLGVWSCVAQVPAQFWRMLGFVLVLSVGIRGARHVSFHRRCFGAGTMHVYRISR